MYRSHTQWALAMLLLVTPCALLAQTESDERALLEIHDGVTISKDSLFLLNLRFRMQNRMGFTTVSGDDLSIKADEARVRRLLVRLSCLWLY